MELRAYLPRTAAVVTAAALLLLAASACAKSAPSASPSPGPTGSAASVVATVDGKPILRHEVVETVAASRLVGNPIGFHAALNAMIKRRLVEAQAARAGITVSEADLQLRLGELMASVGGQSAFEQALALAGLSVAAYRDQLHGSLLAERLADAKYPSLRATVGQARASYSKHIDQFTQPATVKLGDIVVKTERMAQAVEQRLRQGASFTTTARQYSGDPESKVLGGSLGWVRVDSLPPDLALAVKTLKAGQVSRPAQALGGWHVLKLYGRRGQTVYPFARVKGDILAELTRRERAAALAHWVATARSRAGVVTAP